jgi:tetratricopeptide (TPR) repeat protein
MDAIKTFWLLAAAAIGAAGAPASWAEEPPEPAHFGAPLEAPAEALIEDLGELAQPSALRAEAPRERVREAFSLEPVRLPPPKLEEGAVQLASESPSLKSPGIGGANPHSEALVALYAEAERMAGRGRSVGDLSDLIDRCGRAEKLLAADESQTTDSRSLGRLTSWAHNRRGELRVAADKPHEAFTDFQQAILLDPDNSAALHNRGVTLAQYGKTDDALADFNRAIALNPRLGVAYRNRAELHASRGDYARAAADYTSALALTSGALSPSDAALHAGRGFAHAQLGRPDHAARDYNEALKLMPGDAATLVLRGDLFAQVGYYEQAVADLNAALALDPASAAAYRSVAWLLATCPDERFRDADKALEAARRAERFGNQGDPATLDVLAAAYASAGLMEEAVRVQQQATLLAPAPQKRELEDRLAAYRSGRPYRQRPVATAAVPSAVRQASY